MTRWKAKAPLEKAVETEAALSFSSSGKVWVVTLPSINIRVHNLWWTLEDELENLNNLFTLLPLDLQQLWSGIRIMEGKT